MHGDKLHPLRVGYFTLHHMKSATIVNIIGILLEIVGVGILSRFDFKTHTVNEARSSLRETYLVEQYQAAVDGTQYESSTHEQYVQALESQNGLGNAEFKFALYLMGVGMICQLVAAYLGD